MIADCKIIILYLHIDKIKFDYVKLNFRGSTSNPL